MRDADQLKQNGNEQFRAKQWNEALATYRSALGRLPVRKAKLLATNEKGKEKETSDRLDQEVVESTSGSDDNEQSSTSVPEPEVIGVEAECAKARATLNANIGACYVKLVSCSSQASKDAIHS